MQSLCAADVLLVTVKCKILNFCRAQPEQAAGRPCTVEQLSDVLQQIQGFLMQASRGEPPAYIPNQLTGQLCARQADLGLPVSSQQCYVDMTRSSAGITAVPAEYDAVRTASSAVMSNFTPLLPAASCLYQPLQECNQLTAGDGSTASSAGSAWQMTAAAPESFSNMLDQRHAQLLALVQQRQQEEIDYITNTWNNLRAHHYNQQQPDCPVSDCLTAAMPVVIAGPSVSDAASGLTAADVLQDTSSLQMHFNR